jgi:hypothetical protein
MRFGRNLTESEVFDQALHFRRKEPVNHAVYMGMGEPFLNFDAVLASARRLPTSESRIAGPPSRQSAGCRGSGVSSTRSRSRSGSRCRSMPRTRRSGRKLRFRTLVPKPRAQVRFMPGALISDCLWGNARPDPRSSLPLDADRLTAHVARRRLPEPA